MAAILKLSDLNEGEIARINYFSSEDIPTKIYNLGLVPGTVINLFRKAPFNGPFCIAFKDLKQCKIALRKEEAQHILVERI